MNDAAPRILVVEDEPRIRGFVAASLAEAGYRVAEAATAAACLAHLADGHCALIVLDLGLPDRDGVVLIQELREWSRVPVLVLSARSTEVEKVAALDAGADDFLSKPFGVGELLARVRAMLRRPAPVGDEPTILFGDIRVDRVRHTVERNGVSVHLTPIEYRLLALLVACPGRVLTHRHLLREVWGTDHVEQSHYLRIYIGHLRRKLEADPARPRHLLTEAGVGYRFQIESEET
jgi:two-component system KDP operon response regulator KdpE